MGCIRAAFACVHFHNEDHHLQLQESVLRLILALFLPWLTFFTIGRPFAGMFCLLMQLTLIGWIPASIWAVYALSQYKTDEKIKQALGQRN